MSITFRCDRDECDGWIPADGTSEMDFLSLFTTIGGHLIGQFCSADCLLHWTAANSEPVSP